MRARGGDVRIVYSPLDATRIAADNPDKKVVFFGVGFETTAPANAMSVVHAQRLGLTNFYLLVSHVLVPPAMTAILSSPTNRVQGFLGAGHVCTVMGTSEYGPLVEKFGVPDRGVGVRAARSARRSTPAGRPARGRQGRAAQRLPAGGERRRQCRCAADVERRLRRHRPTVARHRDDPEVGLDAVTAVRRVRRRARSSGSGTCRSRSPPNVTAARCCRVCSNPTSARRSGKSCTPRTPLGATMVSSEGACAAYYQFRRLEAPAHA